MDAFEGDFEEFITFPKADSGHAAYHWWWVYPSFTYQFAYSCCLLTIRLSLFFNQPPLGSINVCGWTTEARQGRSRLWSFLFCRIGAAE